MGLLVAQGKSMETDLLFDTYEQILIKVLRLKTSLKKNINVIQHVMGFVKKDLAAPEKQEILSIIDQYRSGYVPLIVPLTLIRHYVLKYDHPWLKTQTYLNPHGGVNDYAASKVTCELLSAWMWMGRY